jgi:hypothetical protein
MSALTVIETFERLYGVPVNIDMDAQFTALARGVISRDILVNERFCALAPGEQMAVLLHEFGHHANWHKLIRWISLPLFWTKWAERMWQRHELEADWFAVAEGFGPQLATYLSRYRSRPDIDERIRNIRELLAGGIHVAQAA